MSDLLIGLDIPTTVADRWDPIAAAAAAERDGFDFVSANDHPCGTRPSHETWTMLSWIAARTTRLRVSTRVLGVPYRPPALVAKMAETFDRLSGGRLILGLGGGASDDEFRAFGLPVPTPAEKVSGLADAIRITRGLWNEPAFTYDGSRHHVLEADIEPKPQRPIPIWVGTFGPRALAVTGELADGWIPSMSHAPPEEIPRMQATILDAAARAGRGRDEITFAYNLDFHIGAARDEPGALVGPPEYVVDELLALVTLGFRAFNFSPMRPEDRTQTARLAAEVIPRLRAEAHQTTGR